LFTFESSIALALISLYLYKNDFFPQEQYLEMHQKEENLTENHIYIWFQKSIQINQSMT
jgi:hypothetical protein